jgi:hypothetical protein
MKRRLACFMLAGSFALAAAAPAFADPTPPTNGGNGGGQSGQCTGAAADRPAVCPGA